MSAPVLVVVEDAAESREMMALYLEGLGMKVLRAANAAELQGILSTVLPALILLDINLPDADGIELARHLRLGERCGLIFVTSRDTDDDVVSGLEAGGDDYVTKPVNLKALGARVRSVLRRSGEALVSFQGWTLDMVRRELFRPNGQLLELTTGEFNILAALAARSPHPASREFLLDVISNRDPRGVSSHTVDTLVARLRQKMRGDGGMVPIVTVRGVGYALAQPLPGNDPTTPVGP